MHVCEFATVCEFAASDFLRRADRYYCSVQYYLKPFHAYDNGNLSWDAALEVELAAKSVHANVFDPEASESEFLNDVSRMCFSWIL